MLQRSIVEHGLQQSEGLYVSMLAVWLPQLKGLVHVGYFATVRLFYIYRFIHRGVQNF